MVVQEELGLPVNPDVPLLAFIGRLDSQKGADLILQAAPWIVQQVRHRPLALGGATGPHSVCTHPCSPARPTLVHDTASWIKPPPAASVAVVLTRKRPLIPLPVPLP